MRERDLVEGRGRSPAGPARVLALCIPELPLQRLLRRRLDEGVDRPVAILSEGRVVHCDAAARAAGVRPGQTPAEALSACGRLEGVPLDAAADLAALRALAETVLLLAPAVELSAPDVLLLDASAAHLLAPAGAGPEAAERTLAARALAAAAEMGYQARAAVASGRAPAMALARHGRGFAPVDGAQARPGQQERARGTWLRVPPGDVARALAGLPLESLGLGPAVVGRLRALGVADAGALVRLPPGSLAHRFGPEGVRAARLARGEDGGPLVPYAPETLPEEGLELEGPAESAEPLLFGLKRLADRVAARLAGRGLGATRLRVTLKLDPRGEERLLVPLAQPSASAARWLAPVKELVFSLRLPGAVVALRLAALEVAALPTEQLAFGDRPEALQALEIVLARLATRLGDGALFAAEPVERYRPEGAYQAVPFRTAPGTPKPKAERKSSARGAVAPAPEPGPPPPRPTRLLSPPVHVVAEGEGGRLTALRVDGADRAVLDLSGPERLQGEWWGGEGAPFDRDYFRIRLEGLGDCWVYRDGVDGRLWLHGFFD
ncbi:MAG: DNA polymerase Y family protein [Anaeromyxobacter sp.]